MFAIDTEMNIRCFPVTSSLSLPSDDEKWFDSQSELLKMADVNGWTKQGVTAIWNNLVGAVPFDNLKTQKCFKNRPFGIAAIWNAIQRLAPSDSRVESVTMDEAKESEEELKKSDERKKKTAPKKAPKVKAEKPVREKKEPTEKASRGKGGDTKKNQAAALMMRKSGATVQEIMEKTKWSEGSVSMFIAWVQAVIGTGITSLESSKNSAGERVFKAA